MINKLIQISAKNIINFSCYANRLKRIARQHFAGKLQHKTLETLAGYTNRHI